jgi:hypothetical protein
MVETEQGWPQRVVTLVGQRVAYYRNRLTGDNGKPLTLAALADRTRDLGLPLDRAVISKLETGYRQSVTVPELFVLAKALRIPPMALLFPVGREELVEVLPGYETDPWSALRWFTGEALLGTIRYDDDGPVFTPHDALDAVDVDEVAGGDLWRRHSQLVKDLGECLRRAARATNDAVADAERRAARALEDGLRGIRGQMRAAGMEVLPVLPPSLRHLDETDPFPVHRPGSGCPATSDIGTGGESS